MANIVTDYSAVADGHWAKPVVSITQGTKNLSATTATWSSGDAGTGKGIAVAGAGASGSVLLTTIDTFTDSTHLILHDNAVTTVGGVASLVCWGTDNGDTAHGGNNSFEAFTAANQGATVALTIPAGTYYISYANPLFAGISNLTVTGTGATLAGGILQLGNPTTLQNKTSSGRTASVTAGNTSVTLLTPSQVSRFTVGKYAMMAGIDMQGNGFPVNPYFFDYVLVSAIDSSPISPTYGKITFATTPLSYDYLSTWPSYDTAGTDPIDFGGPATLYALDAGWNCSMTFNGLTIVNAFGPSGVSGRTITLSACSQPTAQTLGLFPTGSETWTADGCTLPSSMEVDKLVKSIVISNTTMTTGMTLQSAGSIESLTINNSSNIAAVIGSAKRTIVANSTVGHLGVGPAFFGFSDELTCTNSVINQLGGVAGVDTYPGGHVDTGTGGLGINNPSTGATMSGGIIKFPIGYQQVRTWAIPGAYCFWSNENAHIEPGFRVVGLTADATNVYVQTSLSEGFPTLPAGITKLRVLTHPVLHATFSGCTGTDTQWPGLNSHPARAPLYSYQKHTYTSAMGTTGQPVYNIFGNLLSLSINVTAAYAGGGTLTFSAGWWSAIKSDATIFEFTQPVVNAKIAGERVVTLTGTTGSQSGDSGLTVPDPVLSWMSGQISTAPAFSANVSGTDPNVTVVVTYRTMHDNLSPVSTFQGFVAYMG